MNLRRHLLVASMLLSLNAWNATQACGPDFPFEAIQNRATVLDQLPSGSFALLTTRLLGAPKTDFKAVESWEASEDWQAGLTEDEISVIEKLRSDETPAAAHTALYEQLPADLADYERAAATFRVDLAAAVPMFQTYIGKWDVNTRRGLFARYTLARAAYLNEDFDTAATLLQAIRAGVSAGAADPAGLAVASFGEEARLHLGRDDVRALTLYAEQAARGSESGRDSLRQLAKQWFDDPTSLGATLDDPLLRKLVVGFALARSLELASSDADPYDPEKVSRYLKDVREAPPVLRLLDALKQRNETDIENADQIAAIAYRAARFDEAAGYAEMSKTPLAAWVRAKLAVRSGDIPTAQTEYLAAATAFPENEEWGVRSDPVTAGSETLKPACRVRAESALLALDRREYLNATALLYAAASVYWTDLARLAERVLTIEELKGFVDQQVKLTAPFDARPANPGPEDYYFFDASARPDVALRGLLARRLMRAGRRDEALAYFDDGTVRDWAKALRDAHTEAAASSGIDQARALFAAARLERTHGMVLLGFELSPDGAIYDGSYETGSWAEQSALVSAIEGLPEATRADWMQREKAQQPTPDERFHYRRIATATAERAADALPKWSQAYAATLCHAARWHINRNPELAASIYQRYLRTGPWVPWGADFAQSCPAPDFAKAAKDQATRDRAAMMRKLKHAAPWIFGVGLGVIGLLVGLWLRRRTKR